MLKKYKYESMLIVCAALWGLSFPVMKYVGENVDSVSFLAIRFTIATVILAVIFREKFKGMDKKMIFPSIGVGLLMALHSFLQVEGLRYTSSANSSFITAMNVIFVPFFMYILFRQKPNKNIIIGLAAMVVGFLFVSGIISVHPFAVHLTAFNVGDFLTLLCAFFMGLYYVVFNRCSVKYDEVLMNVLHMGGGAAGMWLVWIFYPSKTIQLFGIPTLLGTLYCGVFASAVAFFLLAKAQAKLEASKVAILCSLEPIFATLFAACIWHDPITLTFVIGGILILYGVIKSSL